MERNSQEGQLKIMLDLDDFSSGKSCQLDRFLGLDSEDKINVYLPIGTRIEDFLGKVGGSLGVTGGFMGGSVTKMGIEKGEFVDGANYVLLCNEITPTFWRILDNYNVERR